MVGPLEGVGYQPKADRPQHSAAPYNGPLFKQRKQQCVYLKTVPLGPAMDTLSTFSLIISSQAFALSLIAFSLCQRNNPASLFLGLFLLIESIRQYIVFEQCGLGFGISISYVLWCVTALSGPCLYLFVTSITNSRKGFVPADTVHLLPWVLTCLSCAYFAPELLSNYQSIRQTYYNGEVPIVVAYFSIVFPIITVGYVYPSICHVEKYCRLMKGFCSDIDSVNLKWLKVFLWAVLLVNMAYIAVDYLRIIDIGDLSIRLTLNNVSTFTLIMFITVGAIRHIKMTGHHYFPILSAQSLQQQDGSLNTNDSNHFDDIPTREAALRKYSKSKLECDRLDSIWEKIEEQMRDKRLFLSSELCLKTLSAIIGESPHNTSQAINIKSQGSFYDYVNGYRVKEVARLLELDSANNRKMFDIAVSAGFSTLSTCYSQFKKRFGMPPKEYRKSLGVV